MSEERKQVTLEEAKEMTKQFTIKNYGEDVYNRWVASTNVAIRMIPTNATGLLDSATKCDAVGIDFDKVVVDYELYENGVVIGRLCVADTIEPSKKYYLLKVSSLVVVYELTNLTYLVPTLVGMPNDMMAGIIVSGAVKGYFDGGFDINTALPVSIWNDDGVPRSFSTYLTDGEEVAFYLLNDKTSDAIEVLRFKMLTEKPELNKQYMHMVGEGDRHYYIEVINGLGQLFKRDSFGLVADIIALQALTYQYQSPTLTEH